MGDGFSSWVTQLRKGIVELLLLRVLAARGSLHGYALVRELQELGELIAGESTVYPILKRLESEGLLASRWSAEAGAPRKYYELTADGRLFLERADAHWRSLVAVMASLEGKR